MPVEIKELVIRAVALPSSSQGKGGSTADSDSGAMAQNEATVEACVKEVLRILRRAKER